MEALPDLDRLSGDANALVRAAAAEAMGRLVPLPDAARQTLTRLVGDESLAVARAAQEALLAQPLPVVAPTPTPSSLPACLREQAAAARAYLRRWRDEGPAGDVAAALDTLLRELS
jgi:HEAT repeat protein